MKQPVKIEIATQYEKGGVGRAVVGTLAFGPIGGIIGGLTRKSNVTFRITYDNNTLKFVTCKAGSGTYKKLTKQAQALERKALRADAATVPFEKPERKKMGKGEKIAFKILLTIAIIIFALIVVGIVGASIG